MNTWIFQSVPDRYDLRKSNSIRPGETVTWYATRYRDRMSPGDVVYFWMGGDDDIRGIYGWGLLNSAPYIKKNWDSHGVDAQIKVRFQKPVLASTLRRNAKLAYMLILRQPQASNFFLEPEEAKALAMAVRDCKEVAPEQQGGA